MMDNNELLIRQTWLLISQKKLFTEFVQGYLWFITASHILKQLLTLHWVMLWPLHQNFTPAMKVYFSWHFFPRPYPQ